MWSPHVITCYGWIDRNKDSYKDFVTLHLVLDYKRVEFALSSSAEFNTEIADLCRELSGLGGASYKQCVRIEDLFEIPNMIRLNERAKPGQ